MGGAPESLSVPLRALGEQPRLQWPLHSAADRAFSLPLSSLPQEASRWLQNSPVQLSLTSCFLFLLVLPPSHVPPFTQHHPPLLPQRTDLPSNTDPMVGSFQALPGPGPQSGLEVLAGAAPCRCCGGLGQSPSWPRGHHGKHDPGWGGPGLYSSQGCVCPIETPGWNGTGSSCAERLGQGFPTRSGPLSPLVQRG